MPRPFSPLNKFTRESRLRVRDDGTGVIGPAPSGLPVVLSIVAAADENAAADAALVDPGWTTNGTYIGTYTDDAGLVWGVYGFVLDGALLTIAKSDAAFPDGLDPYAVVHLEGVVHAVERMSYHRGRKAILL
jgi:hypothetical protein